jgi:conjugative transfer signal peptidase TraF
MSQPTIVLVIAALFGTACAAAGSCAADERNTHLLRTIRFAVVVAVIGTLVAVILIVGLRFNFTSSMPLGVYHLAKVSPTAVYREMIVAVCAPASAVELGRHRGYLSAGSCSGESEPLLKTVAAVAGDTVTVTTNGIDVNGKLLLNSKPLSLDSSGRPLMPWPSGRYQISPGSIWLYANDERSWDSRYFGPTPVRNVVGAVAPVLVAGISRLRISRMDSALRAGPGCGATRFACPASSPGLRVGHLVRCDRLVVMRVQYQ